MSRHVIDYFFNSSSPQLVPLKWPQTFFAISCIDRSPVPSFRLHRERLLLHFFTPSTNDSRMGQLLCQLKVSIIVSGNESHLWKKVLFSSLSFDHSESQMNPPVTMTH